MESELLLGRVPSKASVDSGVETGNDSNDSHSTFESHSTTHEFIPRNISSRFVISLPHSSVNNPDINTSIEQASGSVESKEHGNNEGLQFHQPAHKVSAALEVAVPRRFIQASLRFGSGFDVLTESYAVQRRKPLHRYCTRSYCPHSRWLKYKETSDERRLCRAVSTNNMDQVTALLRSGVNPNCVDHQCRSPLHLAASRGYYDIVRLLLDNGANPNAKDILGNTPLHLSVCTSNVRVVTLLLKGGTDVSSVDNFGRSPIQLVKSRLNFLKKTSISDAEYYDLTKKELEQLIEMMTIYLHRCGQETEAELLDAFSSKLMLSHTREEIETGVHDLLASVQSLSLDKSISDQKDYTDE